MMNSISPLTSIHRDYNEEEDDQHGASGSSPHHGSSGGSPSTEMNAASGLLQNEEYADLLDPEIRYSILINDIYPRLLPSWLKVPYPIPISYSSYSPPDVLIPIPLYSLSYI